MSTDAQTWSDARAKCQDLGGDLITMNTAEETAHVKALLSSSTTTDYWIGLTDATLEGDWKYVDGTRPIFPDWQPGEPTGSNTQNCAQFWAGIGYRWDDTSCNVAKRYVCNTTGKLGGQTAFFLKLFRTRNSWNKYSELYLFQFKFEDTCRHHGCGVKNE